MTRKKTVKKDEITKLWGDLWKISDEFDDLIKQSASEIMVKAIKKAVQYERAECAKLASYFSKEAAKSIREREDD
jgi:hypothetical protein